MPENEDLIHRFYTAFNKRDYQTMINCYHNDAVFRDPVFDLKNKQEIAAMWTMLCKQGKDLKVSFSKAEAGEEVGSVRWEARYTFSQTNRKVDNVIQAEFRFKDGLIITHKDTFNFWRWSRQALGVPGYVLGWSPLLQQKVQSQARKSLNAFLRDEF
ncbi:MAG: nuclear transport factor 2 family protein [Balneolaceae bacterium]|nr:nuclear transport factor 2 family protein [Balneolaceae bacterium]